MGTEYSSSSECIDIVFPVKSVGDLKRSIGIYFVRFHEKGHDLPFNNRRDSSKVCRPNLITGGMKHMASANYPRVHPE